MYTHEDTGLTVETMRGVGPVFLNYNAYVSGKFAKDVRYLRCGGCPQEQ